jgi:hypothetical protein
MMPAAYCDESEDTRGQRRAYVVSGYLGRLPDWIELTRRWNIALRDEGLTDFHMFKCEERQGQFANKERPERDRLQRRFIDILNSKDLELHGYATGIELQRYDAILEKIQRKRGEFAKPYYLAFQHNIEIMAMVLEENKWPPHECVAFVFDQQQEYQGHAKELYDSLISGDPTALPYIHRLGSLTFDSRVRAIPLQAADIFAYESRRAIGEVKLNGQPERWQWRLLKGSDRITVNLFTPSEIDELAAFEGWE